MCIALAVRLVIAPVSAGVQYLTFFPVIAIVVVIGGYKPGLLATAIGLVFATTIFTPPYFQISVETIQASLWSNVVFLVEGVLISFSIDAMRRHGRLFQATFEQAAVGLAHVAPNGRWLRVNEKLCQIVGYNRGELMQKTFQDITHPDDLDADLDYVRQVLAGEISNYTMDKRYFHKRGEVVWIRLTVSLALKDDGQPDYFIAVIEDISLAKQADAELRRLHVQADALMEQQVVAQTIMALAHELNQPLNAAGSYCEAALRLSRMDELNRVKLAEVIKLNIVEIKRAGDVLRNLIHSLNREGAAIEALNLIKVIDESILMFKGEVYTRPPAIIVESDHGQYPIRSKKLLLQKVLMNLLMNAYQAMAVLDEKHLPRKIIVRVSLAQEDVVVSVIDSGPKIDGQIANNLFNAFFTTKEDGVGLGLVISRALIESCGGRLWYEPVLAQTAFHFSIPRDQQPAANN